MPIPIDGPLLLSGGCRRCWMMVRLSDDRRVARRAEPGQRRGEDGERRGKR
jgi:hypothetical protein